MGGLIAIVGNTGAGKTTFTRRLCRRAGYASGLEQLVERPFQALFAQNLPRYALANQVDFLLYRAEQERSLRQTAEVGVLDGGLDLDFHLFTHLFYEKGYLSAAEFDLCRRLYAQIRAAQPPPELFIWLQASPEVLLRRYARRGRDLEIARAADLEALQRLLEAWMEAGPGAPVLALPAERDDPGFEQELTAALPQILEVLGCA